MSASESLWEKQIVTLCAVSVLTRLVVGHNVVVLSSLHILRFLHGTLKIAVAHSRVSESFSGWLFASPRVMGSSRPYVMPSKDVESLARHGHLTRAPSSRCTCPNRDPLTRNLLLGLPDGEHPSPEQVSPKELFEGGLLEVSRGSRGRRTSHDDLGPLQIKRPGCPFVRSGAQRASPRPSRTAAQI